MAQAAIAAPPPPSIKSCRVAEHWRADSQCRLPGKIVDEPSKEKPVFRRLAEYFGMIKCADKAIVVAAAIILLSATAGALPPSRMPSTPIAPETVEFPIPAVHSRIVLSLPAWRAKSIDETPYQLLQLCKQENGACKTLADLRGMPGMSIASDPTLALSPDRMYVIVLRHIGADPTRHFFRTSVFEMYGIAERGQVAFRTAEGKRAATDNILGWDAASGHGLEISIAHGKTAIALPFVAE